MKERYVFFSKIFWLFIFFYVFFLKYTQWQCQLSFDDSTAMYKDLKTLHPGGIWIRDVLFWRQARWPLCHAASRVTRLGEFKWLFTLAFFQNHIFKSLFCYFLHKTVVHLDIWTKYGLGYILGDFFLKKSIWSPWPPGPSYLPGTNLSFLQVFDEAVRSVLRPQPVRRRTRKCEIFWAKKMR
jgi:hypothetical protein